MLARQQVEAARYPAMAELLRQIGEARRELIRASRAARAEAARCPVTTEAEEMQFNALNDSAACDETMIVELDALSAAIDNWENDDV